MFLHLNYNCATTLHLPVKWYFSYSFFKNDTVSLRLAANLFIQMGKNETMILHWMFLLQSWHRLCASQKWSNDPNHSYRSEGHKSWGVKYSCGLKSVPWHTLLLVVWLLLPTLATRRRFLSQCGKQKVWRLFMYSGCSHWWSHVALNVSCWIVCIKHGL